MFIRVILLVSTLIGCYIGAGFMSGKEISFYLARFGYISIPFSILCCIAFYFLIKKCMEISSNLKEKNMDYYNFFGNKSFIINLFVCFSAIITIGGTLSGSKSISTMLFGDRCVIVQLLTMIACFLVCFGGLKKVEVSNFIIVPVMLFYLVFIFIKRLNIGNIGYSIDYFCNNYFYSIISFVFYLCSNFFMLGILLLQIGYKYSKKEAKLTAFITSFVLCFLIVGYCIMLLVCGENVVVAEMPLLVISFNFGKVYGIFSSITLWFALFTTLVSNVFVVSNYLNKLIKSKFLSIMISILSGFIISLFGFSFVVSYLYSVIGMFGIVFLVLVLMPNKTEKFHKSSKFNCKKSKI